MRWRCERHPQQFTERANHYVLASFEFDYREPVTVRAHDINRTGSASEDRILEFGRSIEANRELAVNDIEVQCLPKHSLILANQSPLDFCFSLGSQRFARRGPCHVEKQVAFSTHGTICEMFGRRHSKPVREKLFKPLNAIEEPGVVSIQWFWVHPVKDNVPATVEPKAKGQCPSLEASGVGLHVPTHSRLGHVNVNVSTHPIELDLRRRGKPDLTLNAPRGFRPLAIGRA